MENIILNAYICYDKNSDMFEIRYKDSSNIVSTKQGKYGVELHFDINDQLIGMSVPEPDMLFGANIKFFETFMCSNFT